MTDCSIDANDNFSPRYVGNVQPLTHFFTDHSGTAFSLAGVNAANIVLKLKNPSTNTTKTGAGSWTITDAAAGKATYSVATADVNTSGIWEMQVYVPFPTGGQHFDIREIEIRTPI